MRSFLCSAAFLLISGNISARPFIIGGQSPDAEPLVLDSTVALISNAGGELRSFCTGTVINSNTVLTAAHCLAEQGDGDILIGHGEDAVKSELIKVTKFKYLYEGYHTRWGSADFGGNDIAILLTESALPLDIMEIGNPLELKLKTPLIFTGYGMTSEAESDTGILHTLFGSTFAKLEKYKVTINEMSDVRTAGGDSGGPIYIKKNGNLTLHGVLSNGGPKAEAMTPFSYFSEYTHPAFFVEWINCALPDDQQVESERIPVDQFPCDGMGLKEMKELASFNKVNCEKQRPGFSMVEGMGCFPVTKQACDELDGESESTFWDEEGQECKKTDKESLPE